MEACLCPSFTGDERSMIHSEYIYVNCPVILVCVTFLNHSNVLATNARNLRHFEIDWSESWTKYTKFLNFQITKNIGVDEIPFSYTRSMDSCSISIEHLKNSFSAKKTSLGRKLWDKSKERSSNFFFSHSRSFERSTVKNRVFFSRCSALELYSIKEHFFYCPTMSKKSPLVR